MAENGSFGSPKKSDTEKGGKRVIQGPGSANWRGENYTTSTKTQMRFDKGVHIKNKKNRCARKTDEKQICCGTIIRRQGELQKHVDK